MYSISTRGSCGAIVHLPPKVYQLLEVLVAARPCVVTKHELDELLWPRTYVARSSLGRLVECQLVIDAPGISRSHARIVVTGASATIADVGSKNGTYVNRQRISGATALRPADEIAVGTAVLIVRVGGGDLTTQTVARR